MREPRANPKAHKGWGFELASSLRQKIWLYFILFTTLIMILLWLCQIVFLQSYYQLMKTNTIIGIAQKITREYDGSTEYDAKLYQLGQENEMNITLITENNVPLYNTDLMGGDTWQGVNNITVLNQYRDLVLADKKGYYTEVQRSTKGRSGDKLLFGTYMNTKDYGRVFMYLFTPLAPVGPTVTILSSQFVYITVIVLIIAFIISYFISRQVARPITRLTKSAAKLAHGEYDVVFEQGGYDEVDQLADTLNYAAKEISKVDSLRRDLIANTSHDLRTPLTMVKAYAEMIRDLSGDNPEKRAKHLEVIINESDRLSALVNDMLELSKMESGILKVEKTQCNLSKLTEDIVARYRTVNEDKGYQFELEAQPDLLVNADPARLEQAICNFINNAINYTGEDKRIIVRLLRKEDGSRKGAGLARLEVTDTGEGIAADKLPMIWDRYYKVDTVHKRAVAGTGLGLYIVKSVLVAHGFNFGALSAVAAGSTFWFEAPLQ